MYSAIKFIVTSNLLLLLLFTLAISTAAGVNDDPAELVGTDADNLTDDEAATVTEVNRLFVATTPRITEVRSANVYGR